MSLLLAVIYLAFISLGLPDAILGAAWPTMSRSIGAPVSWAGGIAMVISGGTIVSALFSERLTTRFGAGKVTAVSVCLTVMALLGFSYAPNYWALIGLAIPYGLGAGCVDAALNNYVAVHYESRHMSWLHCMWGIGASFGPYIMGFALARGYGWQTGYQYIAGLQIILMIILFVSLPLWKSTRVQSDAPEASNALITKRSHTIRGILRFAGVKDMLIMFFCYCAFEQTAGLWASTYLVSHAQLPKEVAAWWASLFFVGITVGRFLSGFMTMSWSDAMMIRIGQMVILLGLIVLLLPIACHIGLMVGLIIIGLGCAPIYPCVIHVTPRYFGADKSQAIVGLQMASAYVGSMLMPSVFGVIGQYVSLSLLPLFLIILLIIMFVMHERLVRVIR